MFLKVTKMPFQLFNKRKTIITLVIYLTYAQKIFIVFFLLYFTAKFVNR